MFYRLITADPLGTEAGHEWEGLFTSQEVEQIRNRWYDNDRLTSLILAEPACNDCDNCQLSPWCNK